MGDAGRIICGRLFVDNAVPPSSLSKLAGREFVLIIFGGDDDERRLPSARARSANFEFFSRALSTIFIALPIPFSKPFPTPVSDEVLDDRETTEREDNDFRYLRPSGDTSLWMDRNDFGRRLVTPLPCSRGELVGL